MKPRNAIYVGGPPLDEPDEDPLIHCKLCTRKYLRSAWARNHWHCPGCHEEDAAWVIEED